MLNALYCALCAMCDATTLAAAENPRHAANQPCDMLVEAVTPIKTSATQCWKLFFARMPTPATYPTVMSSMRVDSLCRDSGRRFLPGSYGQQLTSPVRSES